jgi:hypothetical protein
VQQILQKWGDVRRRGDIRSILADIIGENARRMHRVCSPHPAIITRNGEYVIYVIWRGERSAINSSGFTTNPSFECSDEKFRRDLERWNKRQLKKSSVPLGFIFIPGAASIKSPSGNSRGGAFLTASFFTTGLCAVTAVIIGGEARGRSNKELNKRNNTFNANEWDKHNREYERLSDLSTGMYRSSGILGASATVLYAAGLVSGGIVRSRSRTADKFAFNSDFMITPYWGLHSEAGGMKLIWNF